MFHTKTRRDFLKTALTASAAFGLSHKGFSQSDKSQITITRLADNYTLLSGAGSNVLVLNGPEGLLMVDGGLAEHSTDLLKAVTGLSPDGRIQALFNTHWHVEHTGSNE